MSKARELLKVIEDASIDNLGFTPDSKFSTISKDGQKNIGACHCGNATADQRFKFCKECGGTLRVK